jgi:hypothetical protein
VRRIVSLHVSRRIAESTAKGERAKYAPRLG